MDAPTSFTQELRAIVRGLRENPRSHDHVNGAASRIDHLGRKLHGIGFARDREIAGCLTAAVGALGAAHELPEEERGAAVEEALGHLEAALAHAGEGISPAAP